MGEHCAGEFIQKGNVPGFASEMQEVDDAKLVDQGYGALRKVFRAAERKIYREFKDQIGAVFESHLAAFVFVNNGGYAALHEVPAHDDDDDICVQRSAYGIQLV